MSVYKDEQHGTWYCKFSYTDWCGKIRWTTKRGFSGKRAAREFEESYKRDAQSAPKMTVEQLFPKYLEDRKLHLKKSSVMNIEFLLRVYVLPYFGKTRLSDITPLKLRRWQNTLLCTKTRLGKPIAKSTVNSIERKFSALLNYAVKYYGLGDNPMHKVKTTASDTPEMQIWTEEEFLRALAFEKSRAHRLAYLFLFYSGMRIGELRALELSDIDFEHNKLSITKTLSAATGEITSPKNNASIRTITMPPVIMKALREHLSYLTFTPSPLFMNFTEVVALHHLHAMADAAGLPRIRIHDLRHSHASYLIHHQVPIPAIAKRLGHATPATTLRTYSHIYRGEDEKVAQLIEKNLRVRSNLVTEAIKKPRKTL